MHEMSERTLAYAEDVADALLGVDRLYRAVGTGEPDDGLVVVNMAPHREPRIFDTYDAARAYLTDLRERAAGLGEPDRQLYYRQVCDSTLALLRWHEKGMPFAEQLASFLHIRAAPPAEAELDALCRDMHALLARMGYDGDLATRSAAWEERTRVPRDEVAGVLGAVLDDAWDRTDARLSIPAPKDDGMRVAIVSGVPFNARCDYLARTVELNVDPILTRPALKHLAVHECYPGHYVQFKLRETWYRDGAAPADGLLSVVNSASSCTFEGIADNGMRVIDWLTSDDDCLYALMTRYRAGIATGAAWRLHALGWPEDAVAAWLRNRSLIGGEGWVANRMRFIAAPQRSVLIWSYWWGEAAVGPVWERVTAAQRGDFLRYLYGRMHSPQTVRLFGSAPGGLADAT